MSRLRHRLEWFLFRLARGTLRALPHSTARPLGGSLGTLAWLSSPSYRKIVDRNLRRAFPAWPKRRRRRISRACFRHFGSMVFDLVSFGRFDAVDLCRRLSLQGWENMDRAEEDGGGILYLSAHLGNWEIAAHVLGLYRGPVHLVARPFNNPLIWEPMLRERERFGQRVLDKKGAARGVFRVLRNEGRVGIVMDQRVRPGQGGVRVPFFGHQALTTLLPAKAALRTGATGVPVFAYPRPGGRYRMEIHPPIRIRRRDDETENDAVLRWTRRVLGVFESEIRRHPEQWLWMHRRWRLD
ncbi:MAG: lysophospholipid acyltransferase family protein [Thermoanaerobaculia bacterium]|nr:lysophospholipid acyltransferase family protein [Thermoanaerobaculia bacterium]